MPSLMESEHCRRCYQCKSTKHKVAQCPKKRGMKEQKKAACKSLEQRLEEERTVVSSLRTETPMLSLLERITLMD